MSRKATSTTPPRLPRLLHPLRLCPKPSTSLLPLSILASVRHPLPKARKSLLHISGESLDLSSTRSSSVSNKLLKPAETRRSGSEVGCSAAAWAVIDGKTGELIGGKQEETPREVASLTKIMTCYLSIQLLSAFPSISVDSTVEVSERAGKMAGTRAGLQARDRLRVKDLLFALMLPSGNDAAMVLAELFGLQLALRSGGDPTARLDRYFVREMNELAGEMRLNQTFFRNPHGMSTVKNISTAKDISTLASFALRNLYFRSIVSTPRYSCSILNSNGDMRVKVWENTNRLLGRGYEGVKTGSTGAAGPCLCASCPYQDSRLVVTVLAVRSMEERWTEVPRIVKWAIQGLSR